MKSLCAAVEKEDSPPMASWLLSSVGLGASKPAFPYTVGEAYAEAWGSWTHHRGTARDEQNAEVSIFKLTGAATDPKLVAARNGVKRLRLVGNGSPVLTA